MPEYFGDIPFDQVIFHLMAPMEGTDTTLIYDFIDTCLPLPLIVTAVFAIMFLIQIKFSEQIKAKQCAILNLILAICSVLSFGIGFNRAAISINADAYIQSIMHPSTIYEEYYVDPTTVQYTFPEQKRNLIYIFLESMETTYEDASNGEALDHNLIPELTELQNINLNFGQENINNRGFHVLANNGWTVAAMIGQTSGIPLSIPIDGNSYTSDGNFLNGARSIGEILEDNGYSNMLMIGSEAEFGGRKQYFEQHGNYDIIDLNEVKHREWLDPDYHVWWGYEDHKLFDYAKEELMNLSNASEPFNFTLLTVDTHFTGGYLCDLCRNQWNDQYSNVISCSSRQVADFVSWIEQQPFYENTTIVIAGDHLSMDKDWFAPINENGYDRKGYYTIINPAIEPSSTRSREISTVDLYPTTLASLGVQMDSNRLALGTNLFTDEDTLVETMGFDAMNTELQKHSNYYDSHILYGLSK